LKDYFDEKNERVIKMVFDNFIVHINPDGVMKPEWIKTSLELAASSGSKEKLVPEQIFSNEFTPIKVN
jgi:GT2 family glycosyltransferase